MTMNDIQFFISYWLSKPLVKGALVVLGSILAAYVLRFIIFKLLARLSARTQTSLDNDLLASLKTPVFLSVLFAGLSSAVPIFELGERSSYIVLGVLKTLSIWIWGVAALRIGLMLLRYIAAMKDRVRVVQTSTLPMFEIILKLMVAALVAYFAFVSWDIDVTAWLASAGIIGVAVGFAAKDTLANLFAGIFILTDAPYKVGDFVVLDEGERGQVTHIGIRSTRVLTRDDIEITIPNSTIANNKIQNETAGRHNARRLRIPLHIPYGEDIDKVLALLLEAVKDVPHLVADPPPHTRVRAFDPDGLLVELRVWISEPIYYGRVLDKVIIALYKTLNANNIEIPYPKQDLYIRSIEQMPEAARSAASLTERGSY
jgi:small-conductance mechanosensitive channel